MDRETETSSSLVEQPQDFNGMHGTLDDRYYQLQD